MASKLVAQAVLGGRTAALILYLVAMASVSATVDVGFSGFNFLRIFLPIQIAVTFIRLLHDGALTFYGLNPPPPAVSVALYFLDMGFQNLIFAAALSCLTVVDLLGRNLDECGQLPAHACTWYTSAGVCALLGWFISAPVTILSTAAADYAAEA